MLKKKRNDGDLPVPFEGIVEEPITRSRAIKLFGATIAGGALMAILPAEADARRKKRRRRRRRKAQVASPTPPLTLVPDVNTVNITNPSDKPLTISEVEVIGEDGSVISTQPLVGGPVTIEAGQTEALTVDLSGLTATELADADGLRLIDGGGVPITIVDEDGVKVGVGDIDVL